MSDFAAVFFGTSQPTCSLPLLIYNQPVQCIVILILLLMCVKSYMTFKPGLLALPKGREFICSADLRSGFLLIHGESYKPKELAAPGEIRTNAAGYAGNKPIPDTQQIAITTCDLQYVFDFGFGFGFDD